MLNKTCHIHLYFSARPLIFFSQSDYLIQMLIQIHILNDKQCRSWSVGFFRSQLIWIYTVCKDRAYPGSAGTGLTLNLNNNSGTSSASVSVKLVQCNWITYNGDFKSWDLSSSYIFSFKLHILWQMARWLFCFGFLRALFSWVVTCQQ